MYRIISILILLFLSVMTNANESNRCFKHMGKSFQVIKVNKNKAVVCLMNRKEYCGLYFCHKKEEQNFCQGDDDIGSFILQKNIVLFTSSITLGSPDDSLRIEIAQKLKKTLKSCPQPQK